MKDETIVALAKKVGCLVLREQGEGFVVNMVLGDRCLHYANHQDRNFRSCFVLTRNASVTKAGDGNFRLEKGDLVGFHDTFASGMAAMTARTKVFYFRDARLYLEARNAGRWLRREVYVHFAQDANAVVSDPRGVALAEELLDGNSNGSVFLDWLTDNAPAAVAAAAAGTGRVAPAASRLSPRSAGRGQRRKAPRKGGAR
jgi:hypothetical protein